MSNKYKNLSIKLLSSPKSNPVASLKSSKLRKVSSPKSSFKNTGLETLINELINLKREKDQTMATRKKKELELFHKVLLSKSEIHPEILKIKQKYKETKISAKQTRAEENCLINKKIKSIETENEILNNKLKINKSEEIINNLKNQEVKHEISDEIANELSMINVNFCDFTKLHEEISRVLSINDLIPYYEDICISLSKSISVIQEKNKRLISKTKALVKKREDMSNELRK